MQNWLKSSIGKLRILKSGFEWKISKKVCVEIQKV